LKEVTSTELILDNMTFNNPEVFLKLNHKTRLETLILKNCNLTTLPNVTGWKNLKVVTLLGNPINSIPEWILHLPKLERLNVVNCRLTNTFDVSGLPLLKDLHIDINPSLTELPQGIEKLTLLEKLTFSGCDVKEVPESLSRCNRLYLIDASKNLWLTKVPQRFSATLTLNLHGTTVPEERVQNLRNQGNLVIKYNL
jgi:Leucine-rich repeat (LRR) protein